MEIVRQKHKISELTTNSIETGFFKKRNLDIRLLHLIHKSLPLSEEFDSLPSNV